MEAFYEFLLYVAKILGNIINDFVLMFRYIGDAFEHLPGLFVWLPVGVGSLISVIFGIVVLYKILGREG